MPTTPDAGFTNLERLIDAIGSDRAVPSPGIDRANLLAELAIVKRIVAASPYPELKVRIPDTIRPSITGPEIPIPSWPAPERKKRGRHDVGITGPEIDSTACPLCKRPY